MVTHTIETYGRAPHNRNIWSTATERHTIETYGPQPNNRNIWSSRLADSFVCASSCSNTTTRAAFSSYGHLHRPLETRLLQLPLSQPQLHPNTASTDHPKLTRTRCHQNAPASSYHSCP